MNCNGVRILLSAYVDGELSPGELLRTEQHLRRCHSCADEVESLRQIITLVAGLPEVELPTHFHMKLHERLVAIGPPMGVRPAPVPAWQRSVRTWVLPAAAAAAMLAVGLTNMNHVTDPAGILSSKTFSEPSPAREKPKTPETNMLVAVPPAKVPDAKTTEPAIDKNAGSTAIAPVAGTGPPAVTSVNPPKTETPAPLGSTVPKTLNSPYAVSFLHEVTVVEALPAREAVTYSMTGSVEDATQTAAALKAKYPTAQVVNSEVVIKVPTGEAEGAVESIREILGQGAKVAPPVRTDLAGNFAQAYELLRAYDSQRDLLYQAYANSADPSEQSLKELELEKLRVDAIKVRDNLKVLQGIFSETTIIVKLEKQVQ